jgi:glycine/D-amino acid oxidase-like deaminating enzyme
MTSTLRRVVAPLSYWHDSLAPGDSDVLRPPLGGDRDADVAIVGAGFTGLWSAYYLLRADPSLRVVVLERETAGFGASGRNGGWCVADQAAPLASLERAGGPGGAAAMVHELHRTVDEVGEVVEREGIDCGYAKGGALLFAASEPQLARLRKRLADHRRHGLDDTYSLLTANDVDRIVHAAGVKGGLFTEHAAALHPARLARGLATAVERLGGVVHEGTAVRAIEPGRAVTDHGTVRAEVVVRATEAYTPSLEGHERTLLPIGNFMIATEPIDDATWAAIGLARRELFEDTQTLLGYGQRTADGRIAWGGLSAPTWWRSRVPPSPMASPHVAERLRRLLVRRFPDLRDIGITHHWGGVLAVPRDLRPGVGLDPATGLAWAGGYFGQGVAASNAAGRTLRDLVTGADSDLLRLPWVGHRSRPWEPEPLRWLAVHTVTTLARVHDRVDARR